MTYFRPAPCQAKSAVTLLDAEVLGLFQDLLSDFPARFRKSYARPASPDASFRKIYWDGFWFVIVFLLGSSDQMGAWTPAPPWLPVETGIGWPLSGCTSTCRAATGEQKERGEQKHRTHGLYLWQAAAARCKSRFAFAGYAFISLRLVQNMTLRRPRPRPCLASLHANARLECSRARARRDRRGPRRGAEGGGWARVSRRQFLDLDEPARPSAGGNRPGDPRPARPHRAQLVSRPDQRCGRATGAASWSR